MTLVILAAGMGSRYGGLKQLDPMTEHGEFIIDFSVYDAIRAGFRKVVFVIKKENMKLFRETVGTRIEKHIDVEYCFQDMDDLPKGFSVPEGRVKPWGTAHAVLSARGALDNEPFCVINADDFYGRDAFEKIAQHLVHANTENGVSHCCMVGYRLGNTLTENGTVSRGECVVDDKGYLRSVTERTKIKKDGERAAYLADDGKTWIPLSYQTVVSMNFWGFPADMVGKMQPLFVEFLKNLGDNPLKKECYLPATVDTVKNQGGCDVQVYTTDAVWHGVTYHEDKPNVKAAIASLIAAGEYPDGLWK